MIKQISYVGMLLFLFSSQTMAENKGTIPGPGNHFNAFVPPASSTINITTTTPHWTYPTAGIKILSSGYKVVGKSPAPNGYVLFSVSDTQPANITLSGPVGTANIRLCLNGTGKTYTCEDYTISVYSSHVIFVSSTQYTGNLQGSALTAEQGADAICQSVAAASGNTLLNGLTFKSLLVTHARYPCSIVNGKANCTGSFATNWHLVVVAPYVYADGKTLYNTVNQYGVFDGSNRIINDENNNTSFNSFWSGIQRIFSNSYSSDIAAWVSQDMNAAEDSNQYTTNLASCSGFTSEGGSDNGSIGFPGDQPLTFGVIPPLTWVNYSTSGFNDSLFPYQGYLTNLFSVGFAFPCEFPESLICVS
ncbi:MAG: DUF1554 domain-containing protein [Legionella sp.]